MSQIRPILNSLSKDELKLLMDAFNNEEQCIIKLAEGRFIGVHVSTTHKLTIEVTEGFWSYGRFT